MPAPILRRLLALLVLLTAATVLAAGCGGGSAKAVPANGKYENKKVRYSFEYPKDWLNVSDKVELKVASGSPTILDQVAVGHYEPSSGLLVGVHVNVVRISHEVKQDAIETELNDLDGLFRQFAANVAGRLRVPTDAELGGLKARQYIVEYVNPTGQFEAASAQTVTFWGDRQYTVNCSGRLENFDTNVLTGCEKVLQSFRFK